MPDVLILTKRIASKFCLLVPLILLPLSGIIFGKKPLKQYLEFPPSTHYVEHAGFSWPVFIAMAVGILLVVAPFFLLAFKKTAEPAPPFNQPRRPFPRWGWAGLAFTLIAWTLAWTRISWFAPLQPYTFSPIWLGYIIMINALTWKRTGHCMLLDRRAYLAGLFVLSAFFWWYFEYLNRFVQNWFYEGVSHFPPRHYFLHATLPFSTVLPAVLGTYELLKTGTRHGERLDRLPAVQVKHPEWIAWPTAILCGAGLVGIGLWPDYLYPLLWVSPLLLISSIQCIRKEKTLFYSLRDGRWRKLYLLGVAALICGFFWELWNVHSLAKWTYAIPFVQRFHLFEMPLLGYAGYIPFGMECAVIDAFFFSRSPVCKLR